MEKIFLLCLALLVPAQVLGGGLPEPAEGRRRGAAATEYKVLVDSGSWGLVMRSYGLSLTDKERDIYFYDTPELARYQRGLVLRARADAGKNGDTTVKLRPAPATIPAEVLADEGFKCEYDRTPKSSVYSCSLTGKQPNTEIAAVAAGVEQPEKIFSELQESWAGYLSWTGLKPLGPIKSSSWKTEHPVFGPLSFERWDLTEKLSFFEISWRITAAQPDTDAKIKIFHQELLRQGIRLAADQSSKTYAAMLFFSR